MRQRKTMKLWQMLVIIILSAGMLVTIFLPAYHFNGNAVVKGCKKLAPKVKEETEAENELRNILEEILDDNFFIITEHISNIKETGTISEELSQKIKEKADEKVEVEEKIADVGISSISPGGIMINGLGEDSFILMRVILWILYMLVVIVLIVTILSFCLEWTKYIVLGISTFYGLAAAVAFGIGQFWSPGVADKFTDIKDMEYTMKTLTSKDMSCFMGVAFLIAFIIAVLLLIVSVVSMFVGNAEREVVVPDPDPEEEWRRRERERQERERQERDRRERERKERERRKQAQKPVMGQVRCTKGIAMGQGFSLPQESKVVVGKSRQNANLLIQDPHVSNIHCSIRYQAATNSYIVKDHSSNGTFVNGVRLQKDVPMVFPAGTVLQLADGSNEITLG